MNNKIELSNVPKFIRITFAGSLLAFILFFSNVLNIYGQSSDKNLKVMTFNIRYGTADDGADSWQFRKDNAIATVKDFSPDVFGLQEALQFQIDEFSKQMPAYTCVGVGRDDGKQAGEHSCIFFSNKRFTLDSTQTFWFSDTPNIPASKGWGNNITRICTWALLRDNNSGKSFYIFNVHLDHESQPSREKSAELLVKRISSKRLPVILTGDFNSGEENPAIQTILTAGLVDTYRQLHSKQKDEGTYHAFKGNTDDEKIDFIFVSKDFKALASEIVHKNYNGRYPSDHFPVTAVISLTN